MGALLETVHVRSCRQADILWKNPNEIFGQSNRSRASQEIGYRGLFDFLCSVLSWNQRQKSEKQSVMNQFLAIKRSSLQKLLVTFLDWSQRQQFDFVPGSLTAGWVPGLFTIDQGVAFLSKLLQVLGQNLVFLCDLVIVHSYTGSLMPLNSFFLLFSKSFLILPYFFLILVFSQCSVKTGKEECEMWPNFNV